MKKTDCVIAHQHFRLYKPYGYLSQFVNNGPKQSVKKLLSEIYNFPKNTMAIGRLDEKSEGLLLLTTDGHLSNAICSGKVEKEYLAQVEGNVSAKAIEQLCIGVKIGNQGKDYITQPCKVLLLEHPPILPERIPAIRDSRHGPTSWLSLTITEGKFRQIRKMTAAMGHPTHRLIRVRIGDVTLDDLLPGEVRILSNLKDKVN